MVIANLNGILNGISSLDGDKSMRGFEMLLPFLLPLNMSCTKKRLSPLMIVIGRCEMEM